MNERTCMLADERATDALGHALGARVRGGDRLGLDGTLGAGKTRLVRALVAGLGIDPGAVSSPSFVVMQEYGPSRDGLTVVHADAWRLGSASELHELGWDEVTADASCVAIVEWASRVEPLFSAPSVRLELDLAGSPDDDGPSTVRRCTMRGAGAAFDRLATAFDELG